VPEASATIKTPLMADPIARRLFGRLATEDVCCRTTDGFCDTSRSPVLPVTTPAGRRPEPVSAMNIAQPAVSPGSATVSAWVICSATPGVSTADQQPHLQVDALERAGCYRVL
jgi:hypothetical protein